MLCAATSHKRASAVHADARLVEGPCHLPDAASGKLLAIPPSGPGYYSMADWISGNGGKAAIGLSTVRLMPPSFFDADFRYVDALDPSSGRWSSGSSGCKCMTA
jgi:hypothetical protein